MSIYFKAASTSTVTPPSSPAMKALPVGFLDRSNQPTSAAGYPNTVLGWVVDVGWDSKGSVNFPGFQDQPGDDITASPGVTAILNALKAAKSAGMWVKVRLHAGSHVSTAIKSLNGGPVTVTAWSANYGSSSAKITEQHTVGKWWEPMTGKASTANWTYQDAYNDLQKQLAAMFDDPNGNNGLNAYMRCITVSMCQMDSFPETFIQRGEYKDTGHTKAISGADCDGYINLYAAGFSIQADKDAHTAQAQIHANHWSQTWTSITYNPYMALDSNGNVSQDVKYTNSQMDTDVSILGNLALIENDSLRSTDTANVSKNWSNPNGADYQTMYNHMQSTYGPSSSNHRAIGFQTADGGQKIYAYTSDFTTSSGQGTLDLADTFGAIHVELPQKYWSTTNGGKPCGDVAPASRPGTHCPTTNSVGDHCLVDESVLQTHLTNMQNNSSGIPVGGGSTTPPATFTNLLSAFQSSIESASGSLTSSFTTPTNGTITRVTTHALDGSASLKLASTAAGTCAVATKGNANGVPVSAGNTYTAMVSILDNSVGGHSVTVQLQYFNGTTPATVDQQFTVTATTNNSTWTSFVISGVCPSTSATANVRVAFTAAGSTDVIFMDEFGIASGTWTAADWVAGTT